MKIVLYTIHCPKCEVLTRKLTEKGVQFTACTDTAIMKERGIEYVPMLEVDGLLMNYKEAMEWADEQVTEDK